MTHAILTSSHQRWSMWVSLLVCWWSIFQNGCLCWFAAGPFFKTNQQNCRFSCKIRLEIGSENKTSFNFILTLHSKMAQPQEELKNGYLVPRGTILCPRGIDYCYSVDGTPIVCDGYSYDKRKRKEHRTSPRLVFGVLYPAPLPFNTTIDEETLQYHTTIRSVSGRDVVKVSDDRPNPPELRKLTDPNWIWYTIKSVFIDDVQQFIGPVRSIFFSCIFFCFVSTRQLCLNDVQQFI
jgi:hypothetical protein